MQEEATMLSDSTSQIFYEIVETIRHPLLVLDLNFKVLFANHNFIDNFKVTRQETVGNLIYNLGNGQWDIPKLRELLETILPEKTSFDDYEVEHDFSTIGRRVMLLNARQIQRGMGKERIILMAIEDITERKRLETQLAASEERFRRLFETANDGILLLEKQELKIQYANPAITAMLGYSNAECIGNEISDIGFPKDIGSVPKFLHALESDGIIHRKNTPINKRTGQIVDTDIYFVDKARLVQCNVRDITERKKAEKEKEMLVARIQQAQKMESLGSLSGGIAHDFNNILFPIVGLSEILLEDLPPGSPEQENAKEIFMAGKRASELVQQILAFSRQSKHQMAPVRVQHILKEVLKLIRATIPSNIEINQDIRSDCGLILADPTQIHQVAMNIITNAYHAVEAEGGKISMALKEIVLEMEDLPDGNIEPGNYAHLSISDTGHGIPPAIINKIFEPYFTTKEQGKGTGLGLSLVYGIIKEHKGDIKVYSEIGKGTTFNVYLPLMKKLVGAESVDIVEEYKTGNERILLVDDEEPIARLGRQMLERMGYKVTSRLHSIEAVEAFKANPNSFDLVVSDMNMPSLTGIQLAEAVLTIRPGIPIIICTGFSEKIDAEKARSFGIKGFLMKPIIRAELSKMVRKVLDEAKSAA
jgi:PAS domain S-box-containing protein